MFRFSAGVVLGLSCSLAGCHFAFSSDSSKNSTDANDVADTAILDGMLDGSDPIANVAFITNDKFDGNLGGRLGANTKCMAAATMGGLVGNFVAVLGTDSPVYSALDLPEVKDTTGWIRTDQAFVAGKSNDFYNGPLNAIVLNERKTRPRETTIWTGLDSAGSPLPTNCSGFSMASGTGGFGDTSSLSATLKAGVVSCATQHHLLCISVGNRVAVSPLPQGNSKRVFLSLKKLNGNQGVSAYDSACAAEAQTARISGTFAALLPASGLSALQRTGNPINTLYTRVDGTPVGTLDDQPQTFLNQFVDGTFVGPGTSPEVWTGGQPQRVPSTAQNCLNWMATGATGVIGVPTLATLGAYESSTLQTCSTPLRHFYCVEN